MRQIDIQTWSRREQFSVFSMYDHPHFNICANVDLTHFHPVMKRHSLSFSAAVVYLLTRTANSIPEFRYRIRGQGVIEHEVVHPSFTVLLSRDVFTYCEVQYTEEFPRFIERVSERIAFVKEHPTLANEPGRDDFLFMSAMPWVSFTSVMHPLNLNPPDSVPRIAWGKFFEDGQTLKMPLSVQAHHALMDGIHLAEYYALLQEYLDHPEDILFSS
jgi:chloramphenicol O-acetyltransferase type A